MQCMVSVHIFAVGYSSFRKYQLTQLGCLFKHHLAFSSDITNHKLQYEPISLELRHFGIHFGLDRIVVHYNMEFIRHGGFVKDMLW